MNEGLKVDRMRVLAEQAVCAECGRGGFHTHVFSPGSDGGDQEEET